MKRKRPSYKKIKLTPHEVANGSQPDQLQSHLEVHADSRGRIGGHTTYRKGPATSSPPRSDMDECFPSATQHPTVFEAAVDATVPMSSNGVRPTSVRGF